MNPSPVLRACAAALWVCVITACGPPNVAQPTFSTSLNTGVRVKVGQAFAIEDDLVAFLDAMTADSRCPPTVTCVWEGEARIRLKIRQGRATHLLELSTAAARRSGEAFGYTIELVSIEPPAPAAGTIPQEAYIVTLKVTRAGPR